MSQFLHRDDNDDATGISIPVGFSPKTADLKMGFVGPYSPNIVKSLSFSPNYKFEGNKISDWLNRISEASKIKINVENKT